MDFLRNHLFPFRSDERHSFQLLPVAFRQLLFDDLKKFDENMVRGLDHHIFPETEIGDRFAEEEAFGFHVSHKAFEIVRLNPQVGDGAPARSRSARISAPNISW